MVSFAPTQAISLKHQSSVIDWVRLAPDKVVVVTADRVWVYRPSLEEGSDRFAPSTSSVGSIAATRKLLDTSIVLAKRAVLSSRRPLGGAKPNGFGNWPVNTSLLTQHRA